MPFFKALALIVMFAFTAMGIEYVVEEDEGSEPSMV
jgi:hypothetical protein